MKVIQENRSIFVHCYSVKSYLYKLYKHFVDSHLCEYSTEVSASSNQLGHSYKSKNANWNIESQANIHLVGLTSHYVTQRGKWPKIQCTHVRCQACMAIRTAQRGKGDDFPNVRPTQCMYLYLCQISTQNELILSKTQFAMI